MNNIQITDEVITNGGIIGRVISVSEDAVVVETSGDRTKIRFLKSDIAQKKDFDCVFLYSELGLLSL